MHGAGAGRSASDRAGLSSGVALGLLSRRDVDVHPKSRVRQPGGLRDPGGESAVHDPVEVENVLSDSVGLDPRFDWVGDHVNLVGTALLGEVVARPEDWTLLFLDFEVAFRIT